MAVACCSAYVRMLSVCGKKLVFACSAVEQGQLPGVASL
jgi:hypothetical protein